jgi:hypothetical protein
MHYQKTMRSYRDRVMQFDQSRWGGLYSTIYRKKLKLHGLKYTMYKSNLYVNFLKKMNL